MALPQRTKWWGQLTSDLGKEDQVIDLGQTAPLLEVGDVAILGYEAMRVLDLSDSLGTTKLTVRRGISGTKAVAHAAVPDSSSGAYMVVDRPSEFGVLDGVPYRRGYTGALGAQALMTYPFGSIHTDPDTGYQYRLCFNNLLGTWSAGDWVVINSRFGASRLPTEATIGAGLIGVSVDAVRIQSEYCWVLVSGYSATANCDFGARGAEIGAGLVAGQLGTHAPANGVRVYNVAAVAGGNDPDEVVLDHPFADGSVSL